MRKKRRNMICALIPILAIVIMLGILHYRVITGKYKTSPPKETPFTSIE